MYLMLSKIEILPYAFDNWHFCTQYFDKKIFFSSKYRKDISKYLESFQKNIFKTHRKKNIGWKMSF